MGSTPESDPEREPDEGPLTEVTIGHELWVKETEVTQREFEAVMGVNPSTLRECGADCPVTDVSWWDAATWCIERSRLDGYESCYVLRGCTGDPGTAGYQCEYMTFRGLHCNGYRLPTDAEWEYLARAGTSGRLYAGDLVVRGKNWGEGLDPIAWYGGNAGVEYEPSADCSTWPDMEFPAGRCGAHPVGSKAPNPWGIYDVLGSVAEWTTDAYLDRLPGDSVRDPVELQGDFDGPLFRSLRGGAWDWDAQWLRLANRAKERASTRQRTIGFRPVRTVRAAGDSPVEVSK